jgi:hypothetical protein
MESDAMTETDGIIPLSRWRAALARARRGRRADAILSERDAAQLVPLLPVQELYFAIQEVGLADAQELVALASPEQVRGLVDLDVWERDHLDEHKLNAWIETLVDAGPDKLGAAVEALDSEEIALWLQRQARVYDLTIEQPPDEPRGHYYPTPDRFFLLDILPGGEEGKALERAIDWLYRHDLELARRVIMSAKWELESDLEEWSYRWRSGRLADLGYVEFYEALGIYRYLDPAGVKLDEQTAFAPPETASSELPAVLAGSLDDKSFFGRALATLSSETEVDRLQAALLTLVNKILAADLVDMGDLAAAQAGIERAVAYLGIGLEYLSKGDAVRAGRALESVALERIFRVGFSLTLQLKRLADTLVEKGHVKVGATWMLGAPYDELIEGLRQRRPELGNRPFVTLADIGSAAARLQEAARLPAAVMAALDLSWADVEKRATEDPSATFPALVHEWALRHGQESARASLIERGAPPEWIADIFRE